MLLKSRFGVPLSRDFLYLYMVILNDLQIIDLRTMEDMMTVDVRVGSCLREYVVCTRGCDVIVPAKDSVLWCLLKQYLVTSADGYAPPHPDLAGEYIRIALRNAHSARSYSVPSGRVVQLNTLFRCFLDPTGERVIRRHLEHEFKKTFHDYMMGCSNNTDLKITEATVSTGPTASPSRCSARTGTASARGRENAFFRQKLALLLSLVFNAYPTFEYEEFYPFFPPHRPR